MWFYCFHYFSENKIIRQKRDYYTNKKYTDSEIFFENNSKYHSIHVIYKTSDKKYTIEGLSATILYENNINECFQKLDEINLEVADLFKNIKKSDKKTMKHDSDKTGRSKVTSIMYEFKNGDTILLACYDWSKKKKYADHLRISLRTKEFEYFLNEAYN